MALTVNEANAVSHSEFMKGKLEQQVYDDTVMLDRLKQKHRIKIAGGTDIRYSIRHDKLEQAKSIDPDDARVTATVETRTQLVLDWKWVVCDLGITWKERTYNAGEHQIIDLVSDKLVEGGQDMGEKISTFFHQAFTSLGTYDLQGIFSWVRAAASSYAGVDQDDATSWNAGLYDTSTTTLALYGTGSIDAGLRACRFKNFPDLMLTTYALSSIYASKLQPGERRRPEEGRAGATDLYFNKVPIVADPQTNDNTWMFIDTDKMFFWVDPKHNFSVGPWKEDPDHYEALRALLTVVGNFMCIRRKSFGAYTAITS